MKAKSFLLWFCWTLVMGALAPLHLALFTLAAFVTFLPVFPARVGLSNLRARSGAGFWSAHLILALVFFNYYIYALEVFVLWPLGLEVVEGEEALVRYLQALRDAYAVPEDRGFLLLGAHFGNIETGGAAVSRAFQAAGKGGYVVLAKPSEVRVFTAFLDRYRRARGLCLLWTDRKDLLRQLLDCARRGDTLGFLVDQKPATGGVFARFFGEWAAFPFAGPDVGMRFDCPVIHATARRVLPGHFVLEFAEGDNSHLHVAQAMPHEVRDTGNRYVKNETYVSSLSSKEQRMAPIIGAYAGWLEELVRRCPSQWFWDYRKWSRRPPHGTVSSHSPQK